MRLLIAEDEPELRAAVARRLRARGHGVDEVGTGADADRHLANASYDAVILDRMLPDGDTIERLRAWRRADDQTPILLLTARDRVEDRIEGLETGADDYLVKPFAMAELLARVDALTRRGRPPRANVISIDDVEIDTSKREVHRAGILIPLRPKEYTLLELLAGAHGRVVSRERILASCWDTSQEPLSNVEEVLIASLRRKLGPPSVIRTVRGVGYALAASDDGD